MVPMGQMVGDGSQAGGSRNLRRASAAQASHAAAKHVRIGIAALWPERALSGR